MCAQVATPGWLTQLVAVADVRCAVRAHDTLLAPPQPPQLAVRVPALVLDPDSVGVASGNLPGRAVQVDCLDGTALLADQKVSAYAITRTPPPGQRALKAAVHDVDDDVAGTGPAAVVQLRDYRKLSVRCAHTHQSRSGLLYQSHR